MATSLEAGEEALGMLGEARVTRHRVFDGGSPIAVREEEGNLLARDESVAYRITGQEQIDDIIETGEVRSRSGKMRGGRQGETQWSRGHQSLGYRATGSVGKYVIETKNEGLNDRSGSLPLGEINRIWKSDGTTWVDVTDQITELWAAI